MKGLKTLVRLYKQRLDEQHAGLAEREAERGACETRIDRLNAMLDVERRAAASSFEARQAFAVYAERVAKIRRALVEELSAHDADVATARDAVAEAFCVFKRFEVSRDARVARARRVETKREQSELDEIGLNVHRRKRAR